ncbi:MAG: ABC transporter permease [Peptococcaceae bacterium]|nr:ABC transporter permease [Peptococcaceae bacterium]
MDNQKVYERNMNLNQGILGSLRGMVLELRNGTELGLRLFKRDFSAKYRQSLFGLVWVVLMPLFTVSTFVILNASGVLNVGNTKIPYIVYALFGLTLWNLFTGLTINVMNAVSSVGQMVSKINFPRISLVFSPVIMTFVDFCIRILLLAVVMLMTKTVPNFTNIPIAFLAILPLILFAIGGGLMLSIVSVVFKDLTNMVTIAFSFLMFVSPVIYPTVGRGGILGRIAKVNPLTSLLDVPRSLFFFGANDSPANFLIFAAISLIIFLFGWRFYTIAIARIVEKI